MSRVKELEERIRQLQEERYELEHRAAEMERAVNRALEVESLDEAQRFLRRSIMPFRARWDRESLIAKVQEWADLYGSPPAVVDWNPSQAKKYNMHDRVDRYYAGSWPGVSTCLGHFDSWNELIAAAGFTPKQPGEGAPGRGGSEPDKLGHLPTWTGWQLLYSYRTSRGMTQDALVKKAGLSHNYVTAIERGQQTNPSVRILLALAGALDMSPGAFFEKASVDADEG